MRRLVFVMLLLGLLTGCAALNPTDLPVSVPTELIPTFIVETMNARRQTETPANQNAALETPTSEPQSAAASVTITTTLPAGFATVTASITPTATPTSTPTPTITSTPPLTTTPSRVPTRTPTITPTPSLPNAAVQIQVPGPGSKIISPLHLTSWVKSGKDGKVRIELLGEDGRLLARKILTYYETGKYVYLDQDLDFEIPGVAETGRLVLSTYDTLGRLTSMATRDLLLLSVGEDEITPPGDMTEPVIIYEPRLNKLIQGSTLIVQGIARPFNGQFMLIELIAKDGSQVGYRQFAALPDPAGGYVNFSAEVPFKVDKLTPVLMTIKAYSNGRISGMIYAISQEIVLSP